MMKLSKLFPFLAFFLLVISSCTPKYTGTNPACGPSVIINDTAFKETSSANYTVLSHSVQGDCLSIEIGGSACNADLWKVELLASEIILESFPPQLSLRFILENEQMCQAYFTKTYSFDVSALRQEGGTEVGLNIEGIEGTIMYSY